MKKRILIGITVLIFLAGIAGFYILSQPPKDTLSEEFKEEAVTKLLGRKAQLEADNIPQGNTTYKGKYITFEYPAKALEYTFRDKDSSGSADMEDFSFDIKSPRIVFNMKAAPYRELLDDFPAVRLREQRGYEYKKTDIVADGVNGRAYYKGGQNAEKSGFFVTKGKIFTISMTGTSDVEVEKLFDEIISSVSFLP